MTPSIPDRRLLLGVAPIVLVGVVVLAMAAALGGAATATVAACGVAVTLAIFVLAELAAWVTGVLMSSPIRPLERLLLTMGIRGALAAAAVVLGVKAAGVEPRLVAFIALPLYFSLIVGEVIAATRIHQAGELD